MFHIFNFYPVAEVKDRPIRTSLYEREGSMWGALSLHRGV